MTGTVTPAGTTGCGPTAPEKPETCALHALARPRFFCGQLLTDQDLSDLTGWVRDRRRLARYREGWGVVCGLDVRTAPEAPATVTVQVGHAVTACGEDIVLPEPASFDLTPFLPQPVPCDATGEQPPPDHHVLDLGACYAERGTEPLLALGRSACGETGPWENSRIVETCRLECSSTVDGTEPEHSDWRRWQEGYTQALTPLTDAQHEGLPGQATAEALHTWLADRLRTEPARHFGFLTDWLTTEPVNAGRFVYLLHWLVQDRILTHLTDSCPPGCPAGAVPLARIWLRRESRPAGPQWTVKAIDPLPPHRRPLGPATWPAERGAVNLGRVLWHRIEDARLELQRLGVTVSGTTQGLPTAMDDLVKMLATPPTAPGHQPVTLRCIEMPGGAFLRGTRVVGFLKGGGTP